MKNLFKFSLAALITVFISFHVFADKKQGGKLRVPIITPAFLETFNPFTDSGKFIKGVMFEPLVIYNVMKGEVDYRLAESFSYGKDLKSITYKLRKGLKWSDGKPLTADDVVFSYELTRKYPAFDVASLFSTGDITSVEKLSDTEVRFNLAKANTKVEWFLPQYFIVPMHIWKDVKDPTRFENKNPVGSGPITDVKYVKPQQMEICRNPNYYLEGRPYLDCIVYRAFSDNSQIQPALMNDEIDWGSNFIADIEKTYVARDPKNHHFWYPPNDAIHVYLNTKRKPFSDIRFRQALSMALDRDAIVELATYGYTTVNKFPGGLGEYFKEYMSKEVQDKFGYLGKYDPEGAKKLLKEAGYKDVDGDGKLENPDGSKIDFGIMVVNGWTDWVQTVQMVTEFWSEIGISSRVQAVDWGVYDGSLKKSEYDAAINWSLVSVDPIQTFNEYFHSSRIGQSWNAGHGIRFRKTDKLIDEYGKISDKKRKAEILNELQFVTAENLPFISLFSNATWFQYNTKYIDGWPNEKNPYVHPVWYDFGKRLILFNKLYAK